MVPQDNVPLYPPDWRDGRETKVEQLNASANPEQNVIYTWEAPNIPTNAGPRVTQLTRALLDTNAVMKESFAYDQYNNIIDKWAYGYGSGTPSATLLRHDKFQYLSGYDAIAGTSSSPDVAATIHFRNLPTSQTVYADVSTSNKVFVGLWLMQNREMLE